MRNVWIHESYFRTYGKQDSTQEGAQDGEATFRRVIAALDRLPPAKKTPSIIEDGELAVTAALLPSLNTVVVLAVDGPVKPVDPGPWRSLFISASVLEEALDDKDLGALHDRWTAVSNIDVAKSRVGLKFVIQERVSAIFVAGGYRRLHFTTPRAGLAAVLGTFDASLWQTHGASSKVKQPSEQDLAVVRKVDDEARKLPRPVLKRARVTVAPKPLADGWITLNRMREFGILEESLQRAVLDSDSLDSIYDLAGKVSDVTVEHLETLWTARLARQSDRSVDLIDLVNKSVFARGEGKGPTSLEDAMAMLSDDQRQIVRLDKPKPIRLRGGPGTGKTFTATLRASWLLQKAKEENRELRVGYFVFNRELGEKVVEDFKRLGLDEFFERDGGENRQRIVISSLLDWAERFVNLDALGVEPLAPYRADKIDGHRIAALQLSIEEARKSMMGPEYSELWNLFDAKTKHGLREVEMEISQFIKARDLTDLQQYLSEPRPPKWWLAGAEKAFKKFLWEVYKTYDRTLRQLGFIDADDVVNDCLKEVSKSTWQQYKKPVDGFDYLIIDEAQDFFRNQLTLASRLVKDPIGLMLCFDEAQAVYSRYPNLRQLGLDSEASFFGKSLERNYRSTKQIVSALGQLFANYPAATLDAAWGDYKAATEGAEGPRPVAAGFSTEDGMLRQITDLLKKAAGSGIAPADCAVITFDLELQQRVVAQLAAAGMQVQVAGSAQRKRTAKAVFVSDAKRVKGQQFEVCILAGMDRDRLPDLAGTKTENQRAMRLEEDLREVIVAVSRARKDLHMLWVGAEPSEFISAMGATVEMRG